MVPPPYQKLDVIVSVEGVSLELGGNLILRNVNAEIRDITRPDTTQGQIVGFLGPSGVGKTKLFEVLAGLLQPTSGTVRMGTPLMPVQVGRVGVVQQHYPLFAHRSVLSNLEVAARMARNQSQAGSRADVKTMLERFGLWSHRNKYPAQLSGGQKQRVAIAQQLLCSDRFLLLDEPFSGLDVNMVREVSDLLVEVANFDEQNTIIIVSHDIASTAAISDTLWLMGRDRQDDGGIVPGAYIKHVYDLIERGLCWRKDIQNDPEFGEIVREIRGIFPTL